MSFILLYHKIFKSQLLATAYHEAAHCIVSYAFEEKFLIKTLTINRTYAQKVNSRFSAGLNFEFKNMLEPTDLDSADHIVLIASAGICGKTIHTKGIKYVKDNLENFKKNSKQMDLSGAQGDYELMENYSRYISQLLGTNKTIVEWSAFKWTYEYLLDEKIWLCTKYLAEALILKRNRTLNSNEIKDIFDKIGLKKYLDDKKEVFFQKRYPLRNRKFISRY